MQPGSPGTVGRVPCRRNVDHLISMYNIFYAATIELMYYIFFAATIELIEAPELGPITPIPETTPPGEIPFVGVSLAVLAGTEGSTLRREASCLFCLTSL